jgi:bifunctional ADP-heptose synthase (sugar kinase/adenylyltransferase)
MSRILVIGESCRDIFVYCNADRLCPDVPVPVLNVIDQSENPGMAKNVQRNIKSLMGHCDILTNFNWYNITKTRYVHKKSNHTFIRVDSPHDIRRVKIEEINFDYDIIVISDYNKGFLTESDIEFICSKHDCVFIDTKKILGPWAEKAKFIKINDFEFNNSKSYLTDILKSKIIHTDGANGSNYKSINYPVKRVEVKDSSGAGDAFIAALVSEYHKTNDIIKSIKFANKCASKVVTEIGVTTI